MLKLHPRARTAAPRAALALALLTACATPAAFAADVTPGTYMLEGGSYTIDVQRDGDGLVVVEPNKRSPYARIDDDEFHFYNDNTHTNYGIRYLDARTIEAFKPDVPGNVGSRLVLMSGGADAIVESADSGRWEELAESYAARIEGDSANVQVWAACAGVAMKRSTSTEADADAYARQMAQMLQQMMPAGSASPCADVMPDRVWR
jgi:hypothetical protein